MGKIIHVYVCLVYQKLSVTLTEVCGFSVAGISLCICMNTSRSATLNESMFWRATNCFLDASISYLATVTLKWKNCCLLKFVDKENYFWPLFLSHSTCKGHKDSVCIPCTQCTETLENLMVSSYKAICSCSQVVFESGSISTLM